MDTLIEALDCHDHAFDTLIDLLKKDGQTSIRALLEYDRIYASSDPYEAFHFEKDVFARTVE